MDYRCSQAGPARDPRGGVDRLCGDGVVRLLPYAPEYLLLTEEQLPEDRAGWLIGQDGHTYGDAPEPENTTEENVPAAPKRKKGR